MVDQNLRNNVVECATYYFQIFNLNEELIGEFQFSLIEDYIL